MLPRVFILKQIEEEKSFGYGNELLQLILKWRGM